MGDEALGGPARRVAQGAEGLARPYRTTRGRFPSKGGQIGPPIAIKPPPKKIASSALVALVHLALAV